MKDKTAENTGTKKEEFGYGVESSFTQSDVKENVGHKYDSSVVTFSSVFRRDLQF